MATVFVVLERYEYDSYVHLFKKREDAEKKLSSLKYEWIENHSYSNGQVLKNELLIKTGQSDIMKAIDQEYNKINESRYSEITLEEIPIL